MSILSRARVLKKSLSVCIIRTLLILPSICVGEYMLHITSFFLYVTVLFLIILFLSGDKRKARTYPVGRQNRVSFFLLRFLSSFFLNVNVLETIELDARSCSPRRPWSILLPSFPSFSVSLNQCSLFRKPYLEEIGNERSQL
jgi:hypothetical protein